MRAFFVDDSLYHIFEALFKVEILKVIDDSQMIDEFSTLAQESVASLLKLAVHFIGHLIVFLRDNRGCGLREWTLQLKVMRIFLDREEK